MKKLFSAMLLLLLLVSSLAQAGEAEIKKAMGNWLPKDVKVDSVRKMPGLALYEVRIGHDVVYADAKGSHVFIGQIIETKSGRNLTEERKNKLAKIKFSDLPLDMAIKQVRGNGKRVFATFEDPNCGYCKKLAHETIGMTDVTIYTFLLPVLGPDSYNKAKAIWCSPDKAKTWVDWMARGVAPSAPGSCDAPLDKLMALGHRLGITGTPTIFLVDGTRIPGAVPLPQLEKALATAK